jgi:hypothetical protein
LAITQVTRKALQDDLDGSQYGWFGELDEVQFLARLYDLDDLPSSDKRFTTARSDIRQHCFANIDWPGWWVLSDEQLSPNGWCTSCRVPTVSRINRS